MTQHDDDLDIDSDQTDDEPDETQARNPLRQQIKRLEKQVRDLTTKAAEGSTAQREIAFLKAGVNPDDPKAKYFLKGYDGDLTAEAIKAEAQAAGLIESDDEGDDVISAEERAAHQRIAATSTGARSTGSFDFDTAIAEAKAAKNTQRVIELKQAQAAQVRAGRG